MMVHALPPGFVIRPAVADDVPVILQLTRDLAEYEHVLHEVIVSESGLRETLFGDPPRAETTIGELDGEVIGFALYFHTYSTFLGKLGLYLEDLYVKEQYRGRGFGRALLRQVGKVAVDRGCGRLEWSVLNWNRSAIDFYSRLGALPLDDWTTYRMEGKTLHGLAEPDY